MTTRISRLSALLVLVAIIAAACAAAASAGSVPSAPTNPGGPTIGGSSGTNTYLGAWFPKPTDGTSVDTYRADLIPFSTSTMPETPNFACTYQKGTPVRPASPQGYPISSATLTIVGAILSTARQIYSDPAPSDDIQIPGGIKGLDHVQWNSGGGMDANVDPNYQVPQNVDWSANPGQAMQTFLKVAQDRLKAGGVTIDTSAKDSSSGSVFDQPTLSDQQTSTLTQDQEDQNAASLINPTSDPMTLTSYVPFACNLNEFSNFPTLGNMLKISNLLSHPATWFSNLFAFVPGTIALGIYNFVEPWAFRFAFWTPHTERGDTLLDVTNLTCTTDSSGQLSSADEKSWCATNSQGASPLGFNTQNLNITKSNISSHTPGWIKMSLELQWLVSALYFIALFGCAILFMLRGHRSTTYHVVKMIPRIFAAVLLTVFSSYLIGGAITLSNHLVVSLFSSDSSFTSIRSLQEGLVNTGTSFGVDNPLSAWMQVILVGAADYFLVLIMLLSIARQLVLVFLVCVAPVACFCIIHPSLERHWKRYLRVSVAVIITPAVMAIMLRLGVSINPIISAGEQGKSVGMVMGFFGSIITLITFWSLGYTSKLSWAVIRNKHMESSFLGRVGGALGTAGMAVSPYMPFFGAQLRGAGRAAGALGSLDNRAAYGMRNMLPDHKMRSLHGVNLGGQRAVRDMYKDMFRGMGGGKGADDAAMAASMMPMAPFMGGGGAAALEAAAGGSSLTGHKPRARRSGSPTPSTTIGKVVGATTSAAGGLTERARQFSDEASRKAMEGVPTVRGSASEAFRRGMSRTEGQGRRARIAGAGSAAAAAAAAGVGAVPGRVAGTLDPKRMFYRGAATGAGLVAAGSGLVFDRSARFHAEAADFRARRHADRMQRPLHPEQGKTYMAERKAAFRQESEDLGSDARSEDIFNRAFDQEHLGGVLEVVPSSRKGKHRNHFMVFSDPLANPAETPEAVQRQIDAEWESHQGDARPSAAGVDDVMGLMDQHAALRARRA